MSTATDTGKAALFLKQAADTNRVRILTLLAEGERNVGEICDELGQSQPAISHHLNLLHFGGAIERRREGRSNFYALTDAGRRLAELAEAVG
jgi:DNA-binding transcriptional ArsR family regulator